MSTANASTESAKNASGRTSTGNTVSTGSGESERSLLTVEQAAAFLQLSTSSIRSYIRQGTLKAFRIAGLRKVLIPREELLKLLEPA